MLFSVIIEYLDGGFSMPFYLDYPSVCKQVENYLGTEVWLLFCIPERLRQEVEEA